MGIKKDDILTQANIDKDQIAKWNAKFGYSTGTTEVKEVENPKTKAQLEKYLKEIKTLKKEVSDYFDGKQEVLKERADLRNKIGNLAGDLLEKDDRISKIKDKLADSLNAEQEAKKLVEDFKQRIDKLKARNTKLMNALVESAKLESEAEKE